MANRMRSELRASAGKRRHRNDLKAAHSSASVVLVSRTRVVGRTRSAEAAPGCEASGARYDLWRPDRLPIGTGFAGGSHSATDEVPDVHRAFPLERDRPPRLADELVLEQLLRRFGDLDPPRRPVGLHTTRGVD